jgi:hypothetical protein
VSVMIDTGNPMHGGPGRKRLADLSSGSDSSPSGQQHMSPPEPTPPAPQPGRAKRGTSLASVSISGLDSWVPDLGDPSAKIIEGDARNTGLAANTVDLVITSPPYWQKRNYEHDDQIGLESTPQGYVSSMMDCLREWRRVLRPTGSIFLR